MKRLALFEMTVLAVVLTAVSGLLANAQDSKKPTTMTAVVQPADQPYVVEYYYKTKWGHADEFITLFKKNHLPLLQKQVEMGRLLQVTGTVPRYHTTENGRWDYRITIVFKNASAAMEPFDEAALAKQLFPDQDTYKREEQRRFEILDAHWDIPIKPLELPAR